MFLQGLDIDVTATRWRSAAVRSLFFFPSSRLVPLARGVQKPSVTRCATFVRVYVSERLVQGVHVFPLFYLFDILYHTNTPSGRGPVSVSENEKHFFGVGICGFKGICSNAKAAAWNVQILWIYLACPSVKEPIESDW